MRLSLQWSYSIGKIRLNVKKNTKNFLWSVWLSTRLITRYFLIHLTFLRNDESKKMYTHKSHQDLLIVHLPFAWFSAKVQTFFQQNLINRSRWISSDLFLALNRSVFIDRRPRFFYQNRSNSYMKINMIFDLISFAMEYEISKDVGERRGIKHNWYDVWSIGVIYWQNNRRTHLEEKCLNSSRDYSRVSVLLHMIITS